MLKCEECGEEIDNIEFDLFNHEGVDAFRKISYEECKEGDAVYADVNTNWAGFELTEEEMPETIRCPKCKKYPFKDKEIHAYDLVRVVMFKNGGCDEKIHMG